METHTHLVACGLGPKKIVIIILCVASGLLLFCTISSPSITSGTSVYATTQAQVDMFSLASDIGRYSQLVRQRFPQAIIIGVKKGGTRALIDMLKSHPQVVSPRGEVHFFDRDEAFAKGVEWYIQKMPYSSPEQLTVEKSPSYFVTPNVPQRIHDLSPTVKLLLIVRNPVERVISDYAQLYNSNRSRSGKLKSFDEVVLDGQNHVDEMTSVIRVSCYDLHIVQWLKYFPLEQIHIVDGDALITDPAPELIRVQNFLGIRDFFEKDMFYYNETKGFYCWHKVTEKGDIHPKCLGSSKGRTHQEVSSSTRELLKIYFTSHNNHFNELVKTKFDWSI